jgi:hypothetical protein
MTEHQEDTKQPTLAVLKAWFEKLVHTKEGTSELSELAISMPNVYNAIWYALDRMSYALGQNGEQPDGIYRVLIDCYLDGADIFAVIGAEGKLYKSLITVIPGGVSLGTLTEVEVDYKPVTAQSQFKVLQQADGKHRWFAFPAATAVLNKNGYLNSRKLFDSFIAYQAETGEYPYLTFYHIGEQLVLGRADFAARDGYAYLVSGTFNDSPLAKQLIEKADEFAGVSIGYMYDPETVQKLEVGEGVTLPVHISGVNIEVSALRENDAACILTGFQVSTQGVKKSMNKTTIDQLEKLAGNDPEAKKIVDGLVAQVDSVNQTIESENMVRQENATTTETPEVPAVPVVPPVTEPVAPVLNGEQEADPAPETIPQEINLTDEALAAIAEQVAAKMDDRFAAQDTQLASLKVQVESLLPVQSQVADLMGRLDNLEQTDDEKVHQALQDMPRNTLVVGYRPRTQVRLDEPVEATPAEIAGETLAKLRATKK